MKRDRYGLRVGKIEYKGLDFNLKMVKAGYAWWYEKYKREQSKDDQLAYALAENNARAHKLGLFQDSNSIAPWQWRKNKRNWE